MLLELSDYEAALLLVVLEKVQPVTTPKRTQKKIAAIKTKLDEHLKGLSDKKILDLINETNRKPKTDLPNVC